MATEAQQAKYNELKALAEEAGLNLKANSASCQMLVTAEGPKYVEVYVSTLGKIVLLGKTFARWESTSSQEAVDFLASL
ncbi:MAG TPA: hypothetical protein VM537_13105 [Anaerolineae bacterium]|nr:hypothetical protein [Anaerolineae bacterium]